MKHEIFINRTYKHKATGEIIHIVAVNVINYFDNCRVNVYESSFAPMRYHYMPVDTEHWDFFTLISVDELKKWVSNYKYNSYGTPIFDMLNGNTKK